MAEEIIDMITEEDEVIGTMTRKEVIEQNLLHRSVFIFVFNENGDVFIQKRSEDKDILPGMYGVSCGGFVQSEETYEDGAERELKEELGIESPMIFIKQARFKSDKQNYIGHIYALEYDGEINFNDGEVVDGKFVSEEELMELIKKKDFLPDAKKMIEQYFSEIKERAMG